MDAQLQPPTRPVCIFMSVDANLFAGKVSSTSCSSTRHHAALRRRLRKGSDYQPLGLADNAQALPLGRRRAQRPGGIRYYHQDLLDAPAQEAARRAGRVVAHSAS